MQKFLIIGSHHIARSWVILLLRHGHQVTLYLDDGLNSSVNTEHHLEYEKDENDDLPKANLMITESCQQLDCSFDFIIDCSMKALPERRHFYKNTNLSEDCIICISDWRHLPSEVIESNSLQQRTIGVNAVIPPHLKSCIEICTIDSTLPDVKDRVFALMSSVGQVPVLVKKEIHGLVAARLEAGLLQECLRLVQEGIITTEEVEKCMVHGIGMRYALMSPFQIEHLTTLNGLAETFETYGDMIRAVSSDLGQAIPLNQQLSASVDSMLQVRCPPADMDEKRIWLYHGIKSWWKIRDA